MQPMKMYTYIYCWNSRWFRTCLSLRWGISSCCCWCREDREQFLRRPLEGSTVHDLRPAHLFYRRNLPFPSKILLGFFIFLPDINNLFYTITDFRRAVSANNVCHWFIVDYFPQQKLDVATHFSFLFRRKQLSSVVGFFSVLTAN